MSVSLQIHRLTEAHPLLQVPGVIASSSDMVRPTVCITEFLHAFHKAVLLVSWLLLYQLPLPEALCWWGWYSKRGRILGALGIVSVSNIFLGLNL